MKAQLSDTMLVPLIFMIVPREGRGWYHPICLPVVRIVAKIEEVSANPYASNNNLTKLQGRDGYRLRVGDWRVIYELHDDRLTMLVLEVGPRGGIY